MRFDSNEGGPKEGEEKGNTNMGGYPTRSGTEEEVGVSLLE